MLCQELIARILEKQSSAGDPKEASPVSAPAQEQPAAPQPTPLPVTQESTPQVAPLEPSKPAEPAKPALDVDAELEKRKARAAKFGIAAPEADVDKKLERAQRFGTGADSVASSVCLFMHHICIAQISDW